MGVASLAVRNENEGPSSLLAPAVFPGSSTQNNMPMACLGVTCSERLTSLSEKSM